MTIVKEMTENGKTTMCFADDYVVRETFIDTKEYRQVIRICQRNGVQWQEIRGIALDKLDTATALEEWELVHSRMITM